MEDRITPLESLSNDDLLTSVKMLAFKERRATAQLVAALAEMERRRLYLSQGRNSLFAYCTEVLHLSEDAAYNRIQAARALLRFPPVLTALEDGVITVTGIRLLAGVLTPENAGEVLLAARHKSKRDIERLVAAVCPKPDAPSIVRKLPATSPRDIRTVPLLSPIQTEATGEPSTAAAAVTAHVVTITRPSVPARRTVVAPLAPDRYRIQFTASGTMQGKLRRAQALLRHSIPNGDPALIFERGLDMLLVRLERTKLAATGRPRTPQTVAARSRHIPASVRRDVWQRDGAQCAFVGAEGRCTERGSLELHHVVPFADGGEATVGNIELRCRAHNGYEAERWFGPLVVRERQPRYGPLTEGRLAFRND